MSISKIMSDIGSKLAIEDEKLYFRIHRKRFVYILKKLMQLGCNPGAKILDVGCYPLQLYHMMENMGFDVYGIASKHETVTQDKIKIANIETDILDFPQNYFDCIIFTEIIEHLIIDPHIYLKKMHEVLKPGGSIIITTPNVNRLTSILLLCVGGNPFYPIEQAISNPHDDHIYFRHNREYSRKELNTLLIGSGFVSIKPSFFTAFDFRSRANKKIGLPLAKTLMRCFLNALTSVAKRYSDSLCAIAFKPK
jgi:2-polyprenyl-3-methyl-5-hydroxy-6-metoxy-1,4-benzoquinol methylase